MAPNCHSCHVLLLASGCKVWKPRSAISRMTPISACGGPAPHADVRSPRAESQLRTRANVFRVRRRTSACGDALLGMRRRTSACGDALLGVRRPCSACGDALFGVRRLCSACGGSVLTCGDLFFKPSQPSRFITRPVLIV